jgi:DNA-directed RNA polymerase specialized sigma24 family protein
MFGLGKAKIGSQQDAAYAANYASRADFCQIFREELDRFYLLAFLLTANQEDAERCVIASVEDAVEGNPVFKEWAASWSRRITIKSAIQLIAPAAGQANGKRDLWQGPKENFINAVTQLTPLERFVFVITVLERYSDSHCAALLDCTPEDVRTARIRAFQQLAPATAVPSSPSDAAPEASQVSMAS